MTGDVQATFCATLVDEWVRGGVRHAVVAPGSRSTPMALALAAHPGIEVHVHLDERAAAFVALGIGAATASPAVVLTTSGTATVHLHAAVVEADLAGVPLLAVTADRPPELHHVGAPQTIDQQHLFGRSVRWFVDPGIAEASTSGSWRSLAARLVAEATAAPAGPGPVHLNLPLREPLLGDPSPLPAGRDDEQPWHTVAGLRRVLDRAGAERLGALLDVERAVLVAGGGLGAPDAVLDLARATGWPVLADPRSGCRVPEPTVVTAFDAILRDAGTAEALAPEAVVWLGSPPASKVLARWVAASGARQVAVHPHGRWFDPDRALTHVVHADPAAACAALVHLVGGDGDGRAAWSRRWQEAEQAAQAAIASVLDGRPDVTEPGTARTLARVLPPEATLVVSSSMPVRDLEWYSAARHDLRVLANRGANGIDGVLATATGVALAARGGGTVTAVLLGDVAFLHDSSALIGLAQRGIDLVVVVVDNDGGGIFSFLPQATGLAAERFEQLFGTPHGVDLAALAGAHGLPVVEVTAAGQLAPALEAATGGGVTVVRVRSDRVANVAVHDEIHRAVAAAVTGG
jgi:2-succinyl-5-enolpyruvyl-6-hydroxy-3-cyclohexene-1-carboxylate synthase